MIETEVKPDIWEEVEYTKDSVSLVNAWERVIAEGWKLLYLDSKDCSVVMTRNGYINRFRNKKGDSA